MFYVTRRVFFTNCKDTKKYWNRVTVKRKKCGCGFAAPCVRLVCGLCSSPIYRRLFFDCSSFSKRNTIEEQTKNKQPSNEGAHKGRQKGIQVSKTLWAYFEEKQLDFLQSRHFFVYLHCQPSEPLTGKRVGDRDI